MLLVGRPLPLLLFALCIYVYSKSRFKSPQTPPLSQQHDNSQAIGPQKNEALYAPFTIERGAPSTSVSTSAAAVQTMLAVEEPIITTTIVLAITETEIAQQSEESTSTAIRLPVQTAAGIDVKEYMDAILNWERPMNQDGHWPPYRDFVGQDYDPNRWEGFAQCDPPFRILRNVLLMLPAGSEATIFGPESII